MFLSQFSKNEFLELQTSGGLIKVPVLKMEFDKGNLSNINIPKTYKSKSPVLYKDENCFAELAIRKYLGLNQIKAYWIDCFHKKYWDGSDFETNRNHLSIKELPFLESYYKANNNKFSGMWDIVGLLDNGEVIFIESKGVPSKDRVNQNQIKFLEKCIENNLYNNNFYIIEWDYKE